MERVAKILARRGVCSRREAERLIDQGQVVVDGSVVREQGVKAALDAEIQVLAEGTAALAARLTVVLNKPPGVVSAKKPEPGQTAPADLLHKKNASGDIDVETLSRITASPQAFSVAGRLDRDSRGLLVLTEDGSVARRLVGSHDVRKMYEVCVAETVTESQLRKLNGGLTLDGKLLRPMKVRSLSSRLLSFMLVEGRNRQIRRTCRHVGLHVVDLLRVAVGPIRLGDLPEGHWRLVREEELVRLLRVSLEPRLHGGG